MRGTALGFAFAAALAAGGGCSPKLQKAGGKVLVDGVPVKHGTVTFYPVAKGRAATATIADDGTFTLSYEKPGDGLPPGEYKVAIVGDIWLEPKVKSKVQEQNEAHLKRLGYENEFVASGAGELIHVVPTAYNTVDSTPLTQTVTASGEPQNFVYVIPAKKK